MKEKLQTKFATRQYMISDTFELYYYSTIDVPGVKEHTHTHYEFYLFLEGTISLEIDGVLYTPTPGDLLLIPPGVPHHLVMHDLSVPYRRFVFWVSAAFAEQLRARSADYGYLMEYAAENQKYLFPLDSVEFNTIQYRTIRLIEEMRSDHFGKETQIFLYVSDLLMQINRTVYEQHHPLTRKAQLSLYEQRGFYIDEHLSEDLSLERLAAELFVSKYHIAHNRCVDDDLIIHIAWSDAVLMRFLGVDFCELESSLFGDANIPEGAIVLDEGHYAIKKKNNKDKGQRQF